MEVEADIPRSPAEGGWDLGLINRLDGDDVPAGLDSGRTAARAAPAVRSLGRHHGIAGTPTRRRTHTTRTGYGVHRYVHRLPAGRIPVFSYPADGAETGEPMVAEGLEATVLPDFSIVGDPPERSGTLTCRPLADGSPRVLPALQRRRAESVPRAGGDLHAAFVRRTREPADR
ncbi:hypothetical protein ACIHEJ_04070 [Streptomyces sp. NPDC052301]|uniref:hypothetical protein n=1 Tax=Streptomyces sp. NPDC052301 TaxID=3365687 RepID=UPI0037CD310F